MTPMAATVALAEPEMAPKNMQARTVTQPRPPVTLPIRELAMLISRLESPPVSIRLPQMIKNGSESSVKEFTPEYMYWVRYSMVVNGSRRFIKTMAPPIAPPMGTPISRKTAMEIKRIVMPELPPFPSGPGPDTPVPTHPRQRWAYRGQAPSPLPCSDECTPARYG